MELLDIRTADGKITGEVMERTKVHATGALHGTSHVWLVRRKPGGSFDILLQKRAAGKDSYPGCYDISSAGHIPAGQDYRESALRELSEELGVSIKPEELHLIGMRTGRKESVFYGKPFIDHEVSAVYYYETDLSPEEFHLQKEEVESVLWIDFDTCMDRIATHTIECCVLPDEFAMLDRTLRTTV